MSLSCRLSHRVILPTCSLAKVKLESTCRKSLQQICRSSSGDCPIVWQDAYRIWKCGLTPEPHPAAISTRELQRAPPGCSSHFLLMATLSPTRRLMHKCCAEPQEEPHQGAHFMCDLHMGSPLPTLGSHLSQAEFHAAHILAERCQLLQGQGQRGCFTALGRYVVALQSNEITVRGCRD